MIDIQGYVNRLKEIGYSDSHANHLVAMHVGNGTLDILEIMIEKTV